MLITAMLSVPPKKLVDREYDARQFIHGPICPLCHLPCFVWNGVFIHKARVEPHPDDMDTPLHLIVTEGCELPEGSVD